MVVSVSVKDLFIGGDRGLSRSVVMIVMLDNVNLVAARRRIRPFVLRF